MEGVNTKAATAASLTCLEECVGPGIFAILRRAFCRAKQCHSRDIDRVEEVSVQSISCPLTRDDYIHGRITDTRQRYAYEMPISCICQCTYRS